jgi:hypothetical protein
LGGLWPPCFYFGETADASEQILCLPVLYSGDFRKVNNGDLTGMDNDMANALYPEQKNRAAFCRPVVIY